MAGNFDKIQLPTNTTDISTLVRYLKRIIESEPLNNNTAQPIYQAVKATGKKQKSYNANDGGDEERTPAKDTHTTGTLSTYGLIDFIDDKKPANFIVSKLGRELIELYNEEGKPICDDNGNQKYCEEEYTVMLLRVFSAWHETGKGRDIHPGRIILQLMCDADMGCYLTEHDVAYFTCNSDFKTDEQYDEIKKYILDFREKYDGVYGFTSKPCKAEIFMPTFVRNWGILEKQDIYEIIDEPSTPGHFQLVLKSNVITDNEELEELDEENSVESEEENSSDISTDESLSADPDGLGTAIDKSKLYRNLTHYILSPGAAVYCGMVFGFKNKVEQIVYFGAPGTGKSFSIDKKMDDESIATNFQSRVIFYPDYTYGDFVGCLRPKKDAAGVDYRFIAGPLTKLLMTAFENPREKVYLIIEEINRGSAAAVFGDLFQLLDRDDKGRSKYSIKNEDMCSIFTSSPLLRPFFSDGNIWFPSNFNLLCTMNTADQNVFVLDSAFKRRFHMKYVPIDYSVFDKNAELTDYLNETTVFAGTEDLVTMFDTSELRDIVNKLNAEGKLKRNWPTFATLVNATIDVINKNEGDQISEDKKLGPFYVLLDEIDDKSKFADKVLYYLKQDVLKYSDAYFTKSYQSIYSDFVANKIDVFKLLIPGGV